ncbi:branched-chain amino acid ABC transporter substrate-binding protein [Actinophytocola sediminis]
MALTLTLSACAGSGDDNGGSGDGGDASTVTIGFMGDLTGENSAIVIPPRDGAKMAFDAYNATNPDVKIEMKEYDTQGKPEQATALVAQAVNEDKITALIGPAFSGESKAVGAQLDEAGVPSISASATNPDLAANGWKYWHRVVANDNDQGPGIVSFLIKSLSPKKAFVVSDDQEYSVGLAESAKAAFDKESVPTETDKFAQTASEHSSTVEKIRSSNADVIFFGGYYAQGGRLLKQLRDAGVDTPFVSGDGSLDVQLVSTAGEAAAEGAILGCPCNIPSADVEGALKTFYDDFKASSGNNPAIYATEGYDAATAYINAVKDGKTTSDDINEFLKTVEFEGVSKPIKFQENGEPEANDIFIYQVVGGEVKLLGTSDEATLN